MPIGARAISASLMCWKIRYNGTLALLQQWEGWWSRLLWPASPQTVRMLMLPLAWFDPGSADGTFLLHG
jgi:hypothetical protein